MPPTSEENSPIPIRCPSCNQRFKVEAELMNRTVECGACEHRFRVEEAVIIKARRFYPGERRDAGLERYQRVPMAEGIVKANMQTIQYADPLPVTGFEPPSAQRTLAGAVGVGLMALMGTLLVAGASRGGLFDGTPTAHRLVIAGFAAVVGVVLLWYANPRARKKALIVGVLLGAGLVSLPMIYTEGSVPLEAAGDTPDLPLAPVEEEVADPYEELRRKIGTDPIVAENERLKAEGSDKIAVGVWLRGLSEVNRYPVRDYFYRVTPASRFDSYIYPRMGGDYLMMLSGLDADYMPQLALISGKLGSMERVYDELGVIEVLVNNEILTEPPRDVVLNKDIPGFFEANMGELESVDPTRVVNAAERLKAVEPTVYRSDISRKLMELLQENDLGVQSAAANALVVWAEDLPAAGAAASGLALAMKERGTEPPRPLLELAVAAKDPGVVPLIHGNWEINPPAWEEIYGSLGPLAEASLLEKLPTATGGVRVSLISLLTRVGGADSIRALEAARGDAQGEFVGMIERALSGIRGRMGG